MGKSRKWLYLPVEVKVRELDAKLLLAYYALKEGFTVIVGEHKMVEKAAQLYPPGIFFSKGYPHGYRKRVITNAEKFNHKIVELDEEGLLLYDKEKYIRDRMRPDMLNKVSQEYCWGNFQKDLIAKTYPTQKEKCKVVGNPRFDLLHPKFQQIYRKQVDEIKKQYGPFILVNTRFPLYNSIKGKKTGNLNEVSNYIKELYYHFIDMVKEVCQQFPNLNVVIRPHPGENIQTYKKALDSYKNAYVLREGNAVNWLSASNCMIQNGCTTSIEAFLLKKPIISFLPLASSFDVALPNEMGEKVENISDLISLIRKEELYKKDYQHQSKARIELLEKYYTPGEKFSYQSIIDFMQELETDPADMKSMEQPNLKREKNKKLMHMFPSLSETEIHGFFRKIDEIEKGASSIRVEGIGKDLFRIDRV